MGARDTRVGASDDYRLLNYSFDRFFIALVPEPVVVALASQQALPHLWEAIPRSLLTADGIDAHLTVR